MKKTKITINNAPISHSEFPFVMISKYTKFVKMIIKEEDNHLRILDVDNGILLPQIFENVMEAYATLIKDGYVAVDSNLVVRDFSCD